MATHSVYVTQMWDPKYGTNPRLYHMEITVNLGTRAGKPVGNIYHVKGSQAQWKYEALADISYTSPANWAGSFEVGTIRHDQMNMLAEVLAGVPLKMGDSNWNCQDWVLNGLQLLKKRGIAITCELTQRSLLDKAQKTFELWDTGMLD